MKKFLSNFLVFCMSIFLLYLFTFYLFIFIVKNNISNSKIIVLGDSHTKNLKIPNSYNYSRNGASYILHYNFLKTFKSQIKDKLVIIALSPSNLSNDKQFRFNTPSFRPNWKKMINDELDYFEIFTTNEFDKYSWRKRRAINLNVNKDLAKDLFKINFHKKKMPLADSSKFYKAIHKHYGNPMYKYEDEIEILFLNQLLLKLESINCKVFLYNSPKTNYYNLNTPEKFNKRLSVFYKNNNYSILDYSSFNSSNLTLFKDADHLNYQGENIISKIIFDDIKDFIIKK